ncbi:MAG: dihydrodiol dehydrogenase [Candidatus Dormibacteraeota bacterium]|nr:dihydrodiol dehydrogenase [Candidatus Dormibacteraeota bacterium]
MTSEQRAADSSGAPTPVEEMLIVNEFAAVRVRKVRTRNGERLELHSLKLDRSVRIDALSLESLTWKSVWDIGQGLETPLGPDEGSAPAEEIDR